MDQRIGNVRVDGVVTVTRDTTVAAAAALMRSHHVGSVVLVEDVAGVTKPVGMLTDRDIVVEVVAAGLDPHAITAGEIVQRPVAVVGVETSCSDVVREMAINGVRRLPVVRKDGTLAGIVSLDDVLLDLIAPLVAVADLARRERKFESATRP